jgi:hypothetical protein
MLCKLLVNLEAEKEGLLLSQEGEGSSVGAGSPWVVRVVKHAFAFSMNVVLLSAFARVT